MVDETGKSEVVQGLAGADDPAMASLLVGDEVEAPAAAPGTTEDDASDKMDADHPRFKKIYGKLKHTERSLEELQAENTKKDQALADLVEHNKKLAESITAVDKRIPETPRPDPTEDPVGYDKWMMDKIKRELNPSAVPVAPTPSAAVAPTTNQPVNQTLMVQEAAMAAVYDDYYDVAQSIAAKMKVDTVLRDSIMSSPNPAKALYTHHLKVKGAQDDNLDRGSLGVGGGYEPGGKDPNALTQEQKTMAANLGLPEAMYAKQLAHMNRR